MNDSVKTAKLWTELQIIKDKLDNVLLPVSGHLKVDHPELIIAMEQLSERIGNHFDGFKLVVETKKQNTKSD